MDRNQLLDGIGFVRSVMQFHSDRLAAGHAETPEDSAAWDAGTAYIAQSTADVERFDARAAELSRAEAFVAAHPQSTIEGDGVRHVPSINTRTADDPFDVSAITVGTSATQVRGQARTAIERMDYVPDDAKAAATETLDRFDDRAGSIATRYLLTGSDSYRSGWSKLLDGRSYALTSDESQAIERAASLTNAAGGFAVPFNLDPTVTLTSAGTNNPWRQISRVERGVTDDWNGVNSSGVVAGWNGELVENTDDSPTLTQPTVTAQKASAFVPFSIEIGQDWQGMEGEVRMMLDDAKDVLEGTAFATGSGTLQPRGIVTALVAASPSRINVTAGSNIIAKADVFATQANVGPRFRSAGSWVANLAIINAIRQLGTTEDALLSTLVAGSPEQMLGRSVYESSDMDGTFGSGENYALIYGDFRNYLIYDRIGMTVELIPHVFGTTNNYPTGQRGFYAHWRVGGNSRNDNAFSVLNIT